MHTPTLATIDPPWAQPATATRPLDPLAERFDALQAAEQALAREEKALAAAELVAEADLVGIEGRSRALQRQIGARVSTGDLDAAALLDALPRPPPPPGLATRRRALEVRKAALEARREMMSHRVRRLERMTQELEAAAGALALVEKALAEPEPRVADFPRPLAAEPEDNRRDNRRVRLDCEVGLGTSTNFFTGFARNVSSGGLFVATFDTLPIGTPVAVNFALPSGQTVEAKAKVAWLRDLDDDRDHDVWPGMGLSFEDLDTRAQFAVEAFMAEREPLFHPES